MVSRDVTALDCDEPLDAALSAVRSGKDFTTCPVFRAGELAGLLTAENVGEFFMIRAALGKNRTPERGPRVPPVIDSVPLYASQPQRTQ